MLPWNPTCMYLATKYLQNTQKIVFYRPLANKSFSLTVNFFRSLWFVIGHIFKFNLSSVSGDVKLYFKNQLDSIPLLAKSRCSTTLDILETCWSFFSRSIHRLTMAISWQSNVILMIQCYTALTLYVKGLLRYFVSPFTFAFMLPSSENRINWKLEIPDVHWRVRWKNLKIGFLPWCLSTVKQNLNLAFARIIINKFQSEINAAIQHRAYTLGQENMLYNLLKKEIENKSIYLAKSHRTRVTKDSLLVYFRLEILDFSLSQTFFYSPVEAAAWRRKQFWHQLLWLGL